VRRRDGGVEMVVLVVWSMEMGDILRISIHLGSMS
jgi:hypothetical protein